MMSYTSFAILVSSLLFSYVAPTPKKTVTLEGAISSKADAEVGHFTIAIEMDIKEGWHTYDEPGEGPEVRTSLELKTLEGVKAEGTWNRPVGIEGSEELSRHYVGKVRFSKSVFVDPSAYGKSVDVVVDYQACTEDFCNPPKTKTITIAIPEAAEPLKADALEASAIASDDPGFFERPVRLTVDGKALNAVEKIRFPSPGIFDVDGDGKAELVIGGLMGSVGVYENLNKSEKEDPVWSSREEFKDANGEEIETSNW